MLPFGERRPVVIEMAMEITEPYTAFDRVRVLTSVTLPIQERRFSCTSLDARRVIENLSEYVFVHNDILEEMRPLQAQPRCSILAPAL
jgi:hypothetical protein